MEHERSTEENSERTGAEPCALLALWPEPDAPNEEEIRNALECAFGELKETQELEATPDSPWCKAFEIAGSDTPILVWAEARGDLNDAFIESWLDIPAERDAAVKCRWLLGVETVLDAQAPTRSYQHLLKVLVAASVPGLPAVYDDGALCLHSGQRVREIAAGSVPPHSSVLYAVHTLPGRGGNWIHTHGLSRAGIPDLELLCVPADDQPEATDLLDAAADALVGGAEPDDSGILQLGDDLSVRVMGAAEALERMPASVSGGTEQRAEHPTDSWVILDSKEDGPPRTAISRMAQDVVLYKSPAETERQREQAVSRFGIMGQLFALHRRHGWQFRVKLAFERNSTPEFNEYLWFDVRDLKPGQVLASLLCSPRDVSTLKEGVAEWHSLDRLTDWVVLTPDGAYDPETAPRLLVD